ncbi:MAG: hypothetical protein KKG64_03980 [Firmicutes bacterium]|nr:hypothetical protein [Bacillota bacterium]
MSNTEWNIAEKGSQFQLQHYVNYKRVELNSAILAESDIQIIEWVSPIKQDKYVELKDSSFRKLDILSSINNDDWKRFWPMNGGPHWDGIAIGVKGDKKVLCLIEAKSYPEEMISTCKAVGAKSKKTISTSLNKYLSVPFDEKVEQYYQLANRIVFTKFINEKVMSLNIEAYLLFINFYMDHTHTKQDKICEKSKFISATESALMLFNESRNNNIIKIYIEAVNKPETKINVIESTLLRVIENLTTTQGTVIYTNDKQLIATDKFGSVYGFGVKVKNRDQLKQIYDEAKAKSTLNDKVLSLSDWKPIPDTEIYPLYWGISDASAGRFNAHMSDEEKYKETGAIKLNSYASLINEQIEVYFGTVLCDYTEIKSFENKLQETYCNLLKTF